MSQSRNWLDPAFEAVAIDDEGRACSDIPDEACRDEAGNFFTHVGALSLSKSADSLIDPKLVLSWLLSSLGAPAAIIGLLVPVREAGALLPQMFTAASLRRLPQRKWAWAAGSVAQGIAAGAIAICALTLTGLAAGLAILSALALLAVARSVCSVCYKDVLGKTIDKSRRGRTTGLASSLAAIVSIAFAAIIVVEGSGRYIIVIGAIMLAALLWILAGILFTRLTEKPGATEGEASAFKTAVHNLRYLKEDRQLQLFILTRGLLTATAFAPPFIVALGAGRGAGLSNLGLLIFASALAALLSSFVWGRLADQSSRKVLVYSGLIGAVALTSTAILAWRDLIHHPAILPSLLFILMIGYQGVRLGRSTHLVDMASEDTRAAYTALSNSVVGLILLCGSALGVLAALAGLMTVVATLAAMCAIAIPVAWRLDEVQRDP